MRKWTIAALLVSGTTAFSSQSSFNADQNQWVLTNGAIQATFRLTPEGYFLTQSIVDLVDGDVWAASTNPGTSLVHLQAGKDLFDSQRRFLLVDQYTQSIAPSGLRQYIVLQDANGAAQITVLLDLYDNQPGAALCRVLSQSDAVAVYITSVDLVPFSFADDGLRFTAFRVNQWSVLGVPANFEQTQSLLDTTGDSVEVYSGAHGQQCGWLAVRDTNLRGLFAGWEFDGRAKTTVLQQSSPGHLQFNSSVLNLNHAVAPMSDFQVPWGFLGLFHGDFDEAGYRTQRFVESVLAAPAPDPADFPFVAWDSWEFQGNIDETVLKRNADIAASLGIELFLVDLGWARSIGDWHEDPVKFPHGLAAIADYVHSLHMKFGLHFALTEAAPSSPGAAGSPGLDFDGERRLHGRQFVVSVESPGAGLVDPARTSYHRRLSRGLDLAGRRRHGEAVHQDHAYSRSRR